MIDGDKIKTHFSKTLRFYVIKVIARPNKMLEQNSANLFKCFPRAWYNYNRTTSYVRRYTLFLYICSMRVCNFNAIPKAISDLNRKGNLSFAWKWFRSQRRRRRRVWWRNRPTRRPEYRILMVLFSLHHGA